MNTINHPAVAEYLAGDTVRAIIKRHQIATRTLYQMLAEAGVPKRTDAPLTARPVFSDVRAYRPEITSLKQIEIRNLLESGRYLSLAAIARAAGVSLSYVSRLRAQWCAEGNRRTTMLIVNFAHPFTPSQIDQLRDLIGADVVIRDVRVQVDRARPIEDAVDDVIADVGLQPDEWAGVILNPPALAPVALALVARLHGMVGLFPAMIVMRPVPGSITTMFEVAEVVNLDKLRARARAQR